MVNNSFDSGSNKNIESHKPASLYNAPTDDTTSSEKSDHDITSQIPPEISDANSLKEKQTKFKATNSKTLSIIGKFFTNAKSSLGNAGARAIKKLKNLNNTSAVKFVKKVGAKLKKEALNTITKMKPQKRITTTFSLNNPKIIEGQIEKTRNGDFDSLLSRVSKSNDSEMDQQIAEGITGFYTQNPKLDKADQDLRATLSERISDHSEIISDEMDIRTLVQAAGGITKEELKDKKLNKNDYQKILIPEFDIKTKDNSPIVTVTRTVKEMFIPKNFNSVRAHQKKITKKSSFRTDIQTGYAQDSAKKSGSVQCYNRIVGKILSKFGLAIPMKDNFGNSFYVNKKSLIAATASSKPEVAKLLKKDPDIEKSFKSALKSIGVLTPSNLKSLKEGVISAENNMNYDAFPNPAISFILSKNINTSIYNALASEGLIRTSGNIARETGDITELSDSFNDEIEKELEELKKNMPANESIEIDPELAAIEDELEESNPFIEHDIFRERDLSFDEVVSIAVQKMTPPNDKDIEEEYNALIDEIENQEILHELENLEVFAPPLSNEDVGIFDLPPEVTAIDIELFTDPAVNGELGIGSMESSLQKDGDYILVDTNTVNNYILFSLDETGRLKSQSVELTENGKVSIDGDKHFESFSSAIEALNLKNNVDPLTQIQ
ncbi:MAG: hypothetical protein VX777_10095 [Chlamydiota bacterium]|nr:hypothetical protein [Chlamydiota bacterium]